MSDDRGRDGNPAGAPSGAQAPWSAPGRVPAPSGGTGTGTGREPLPAPGYGPAPAASDAAQPYGRAPSPYGQAPAAPDVATPAPHPAADDPPSPFAADAKERDRVFAGPGYTSAGLRNDGFAVGAMVLGILGIVVPGVCLVAIVLGHGGLHRLRTSYSGGRGLAVAGLVLGYAGLAIWVSVLLLYLALRTFS
ncbi:DUF4190 domain-containing protein [Georgenia wangjunii]|uniref:DUF4190 domain-containing protein n=1 Tax=Georgenia wangjunii TaxID=3117730 RepID=UPI002F265A9C